MSRVTCASRAAVVLSYSLHLKEMVDVMGGSDSASFAEYEDLCVLAFLAVRALQRACNTQFFLLCLRWWSRIICVVGEKGGTTAAGCCAVGSALQPLPPLPVQRRANNSRDERASASAGKRAASITVHARSRAGRH